jgi:CDP-paratose 2-epimerase
MKYLITGGCGFLGSNIASKILELGGELVIFDNLSRIGSFENLEWLKEQGDFLYIHGDIRNENDVDGLIRDNVPDVVYHLAGQVAMTTSIDNPRYDFEVNSGGTFNLLNSVKKHSPNSIVVYSSTNKVYGDLEEFSYLEANTRYECVERPDGFNEDISLNFHSPYGVSKGCADQYMLDFARIYGLKTVVFRHSSMYGGRQFSTYDQGWVGWFIQQAISIERKTKKEFFTISGNGKQVRDLLHAEDVVSLYLQVPSRIEQISGQAFNIGGGIKNSSSLLELFTLLESKLSIKMNYQNLPVRESDQKIFVADFSKIKKDIGWKPLISKAAGIDKMIEWVSTQDLK